MSSSLRTARGRTAWPEVVFADDVLSRAALSKAVKERRAIRLAPGIYTGRVFSDPEEIVRRNWAQIIDHELPGAVISDRSARRGGPERRLLTVVHTRRRPLLLPGLTVLPRPGAGPLPGDVPMMSLWIASEARAFLENLRRSHRRYLTQAELENWLGDLLNQGGPERLERLREAARRLAGRQEELERALRRLDGIVGAALATQPMDVLATDALRAHATGEPFDRTRLELFGRLAQALADVQVRPLSLLARDEHRRTLLPFYESYFSNYIEGTEFTLDEAAAIILEGQERTDRPQDAHDILSTYRLVKDPGEMRRAPIDPEDFLGLLADRHRRLMAARPEERPGEFKVRDNRAGSTLFVRSDLVAQTLRRAFEAGRQLRDPFARAVYIGFVVSEVHPFGDGNGRISRIAMNAELSRAGESRIILPTVYRNNYLSALRGATHNDNFDGLVAALDFARRYTARIDFSSRASAESDLGRTNALRDPNEADAVGVRLQMP